MRMRAWIALAIAVASVTGCNAALPSTPSTNPTVSPVSHVTSTPTPSGRGTWTADTGIYGTNFHFGPPGYVCGVGYNLSYSGGAPLISVDAGVLFPDMFATHVTPPSVATGWQHPTMQITSPTAIHDAAWLSQFGGAIGGLCNNGQADLDSLRGTILRVKWETVEGSYVQEFQIDDIRGEMTVFGMPDGRTRVCWALHAGC